MDIACIDDNIAEIFYSRHRFLFDLELYCVWVDFSVNNNMNKNSPQYYHDFPKYYQNQRQREG